MAFPYEFEKIAREDDGITHTPEGVTPMALVLILFDRQNNLFLLQQRHDSNKVSPNEVMFPSEKGLSNISTGQLLKKCLDEECGGIIPIEFIEIGSFSVQKVGLWGSGIVKPVLVTSWSGQIADTDTQKGKFLWVGRSSVMETLTNDASKHLFWMALCSLGLIKASDFELAPKIKFPTNN